MILRSILPIVVTLGILTPPVLAQQGCPYQPIHKNANISQGMTKSQVERKMGAPNCVQNGSYYYTIQGGKVLVINFSNGRVIGTQVLTPAG
jgi:outer membrane protein assembly factor BamE (lipoprotein component of BamABCDE complex)